MTGDAMTAISVGQDPEWSTLSAPEALRRHAPAATEALRFLESAIAVSAIDVAVVRQTCAEALGLSPLDLGPVDGDGDGERSDRLRIAATFAGQFSVDVSVLDDTLRQRFTGEYRRQAFPLVQMIWVADMVPRVRAALDGLFGSSPADWAALPPVPTEDPWPLVEEFTRVVYNLHALDPVTSEIVRLRGARQHDCRLCRSLRSRPALAAGATEQLFDAIDHADSRSADGELSPRHRTAIALTDAMIWQPAAIAESVLAEVREHYSPAEAVEIVLDVMRNAANKIAVSLGADEARITEGTEIYDIDPDGTMHIGLDEPLASERGGPVA